MTPNSQNQISNQNSSINPADLFVWNIFAHFLVLGGICLIVYTTTLFPLLALLTMLWFLPSAAALIIFSSRNEPSLSITIFLFNVGSILFYIVPLSYQLDNIYLSTSHLFTNPKTWIIVYGVSALGLIIHYFLPRFFAEIMLWQAEKKIKKLRDNVAILEKEWDLK